MTLLASPLESIESAVIWLLVVFSVATWGLALLNASRHRIESFINSSGLLRVSTRRPS